MDAPRNGEFGQRTGYNHNIENAIRGEQMARRRSAVTGQFINKSNGSMRLSKKAVEKWKDTVKKSDDRDDSERKVVFR